MKGDITVLKIYGYQRSGYVPRHFFQDFLSGLRLGWVAASKDVVSEYVKIKQSADLHTSNFDQGIADAYMENYDLDKHVEEIKALYKNAAI